MHRNSHKLLGNYLAKQYLIGANRLQIHSFILGCVQPDRNPTTYLKGSVKYQWLRGHNYHNAKGLMWRLSRRLERKQQLNLFDYYTLGKLVHYTADAFTYAHNTPFPRNLALHRQYEQNLQQYFMDYLCKGMEIVHHGEDGIISMIYKRHLAYSRYAYDVHADTEYILSACCGIFERVKAIPRGL